MTTSECIDFKARKLTVTCPASYPQVVGYLPAARVKGTGRQASGTVLPSLEFAVFGTAAGKRQNSLAKFFEQSLDQPTYGSRLGACGNQII